MKKSCVFFLLLLGGCAQQTIWFNPTRNFTQAQADLRECRQSGAQPADRDDPLSACMRDRGYYLVDQKFSDAYRQAE